MDFIQDAYDDRKWLIWDYETGHREIVTPEEKAEFAYWVALTLANKLLMN